uniref:Mannose-P-dolichol utilization defect 1 protein n=1 Tax=Magallana gigas TaxID=29159 RepID=K1R7D3_MAGGI
MFHLIFGHWLLANIVFNYVMAAFTDPGHPPRVSNIGICEVQCFNVVLSKALGYGIILGAVLVKLPQIMKIVSAGSGKGISLVAVMCELFAISATTTYGFAMSFPFRCE